MAHYMMSEPDDERVDPRERHVVDVMDAARGATEKEVVDCLRYLYHERGLRPGTKNGPRHFSWFPTLVADYFAHKRQRAFAANFMGNADPFAQKTLCNKAFNSKTDAVEIERSNTETRQDTLPTGNEIDE